MSNSPVAVHKKKKDSLAVRQPAEVVRAKTAVANIVRTVNDLKIVRRFIKKALTKGVDFGRIPGTNRDFLLQPGAEKFCQWLHVRPVYDDHESELGEGHLECVTRCRLVTAEEKEVMQSPKCSCSTMETNFRYRWAVVDPPNLVHDPPSKEEAKQLAAVKMGRWLVTSTATGKKLVSPSEVPRGATITNWYWQPRVPNPNFWDERNKVRQMSGKRALVRAVRTLGALSEIFSEDPDEWGELEIEALEAEEEPAGRVKREPAQAVIPAQRPEPSPKQPHTGPETALGSSQTGAKKVLASWVGKTSVNLSGDLPTILHEIEERCLAVWLPERKCWSIPPAYMDDLAEICAKHDIDLEEAQAPQPGEALVREAERPERRETQAEPATPAQPTATTGSAPAAQKTLAALEPGLGLVTRVRSDLKTKTNRHPYMQVLWKGVWCSCFKEDLFRWLAAALDKQADLEVETARGYPVITGIKSISGREFDEAGPIRTMNDEPGKLF